MSGGFFLTSWSPLLFTIVAAAAVTAAVYRHYNNKEKQHKARIQQLDKRASNFPKCVLCKNANVFKLEPCGHDMCLDCNLGMFKADSCCPECGKKIMGPINKESFTCALCMGISRGIVLKCMHSISHFFCHKCKSYANNYDKCPVCKKKCDSCYKMEYKVKMEPCGHCLCHECGVYAVSEYRKCHVCHSKLTGPDKWVKNVLYPKKCMICDSQELVRNLPCDHSLFCEEHISLHLQAKCPTCKTEITDFTRS